MDNSTRGINYTWIRMTTVDTERQGKSHEK